MTFVIPTSCSIRREGGKSRGRCRRMVSGTEILRPDTDGQAGRPARGTDPHTRHPL